MDFSTKDLKKLADTCRKAGISTFKGFGVEFTLGAVPHKARRESKAHLSTFEQEVLKSQQTPVKAVSEPIKTDTLTEMDLLFWSAGNGQPEEESST